MTYIGIDLGTTGCKSILFDENGTVLSEFYEEYALIADGEHVEQDAELWWTLVLKAIATVAKAAKQPVKALSISSQGISFVPVNAKGQPLANAISWLDTRAQRELDEITQKFGEDEIYMRTGKRLLPAYTYSKLMHAFRTFPDVYQQAYKVLLPLDYLNFRLTGNPLTDRSMASGTMFYNINTCDWDEELLAFGGIPRDKLPNVGIAGDFVGTLLPAVAEKTGLLDTVEVYLGAQDQKCAAIGAGIDEDSCTVSLGTSTAITKFQKQPMVDLNQKIPCFVLDEEHWVSEFALSTTGAALRWLSQSLFDGKNYRELDRLAEMAPSGCNGVRFHCDLTAQGSISGLSLSTSQGDIVRALYEDIGRSILDAVNTMGGAKRILLFGGGSKSDIWCRVIAEMTQLPVCVLSTSETANLGAAILASRKTIPSAKIVKTYRKEWS